MNRWVFSTDHLQKEGSALGPPTSISNLENVPQELLPLKKREPRPRRVRDLPKSPRLAGVIAGS